MITFCSALGTALWKAALFQREPQPAAVLPRGAQPASAYLADQGVALLGGGGSTKGEVRRHTSRFDSQGLA
jgi:hypothetical protein